RARAERNFRQAQRLLDYIAETAAAEAAGDSDLPNFRRQLLDPVLTYYEQFIEQHNDNQLNHEKLMRDDQRIAALFEARGRRDDARVAWDQAFQIAMTNGDDQAPFRLNPVNNKLNLLKLEAVQKQLKLRPEQVRAIDNKKEPQGKKQAEAID